jgi:glycerophosphoryl diester phosphodiesterase
VLVARHENEISGTTDVAAHPAFTGRRTTRLVDGAEVTGWFTEDFTLEELRTLRAVERIPAIRPANAAFDGRFGIPTFAEIIALARREGVGIYPETKHPSHFSAIGLPLEEPLLAALDAGGYGRPGDPVFIQSFETGNLRRLRAMTQLPLVQLLDRWGAPFDLRAAGDQRTYADLATPSGLELIRTYADAIGPHKDLVIPRDPDGRLGPAASLVGDAHDAGLLVHAWTFRGENMFLPADCWRGDPDDAGFAHVLGETAAELRRFYALGLDGVFADHPDVAVAARS